MERRKYIFSINLSGAKLSHIKNSSVSPFEFTQKAPGFQSLYKIGVAKKDLPQLLPVPSKSVSPLAANISTKTFLIAPNEKNIKTISFNFLNNICDVKLEADNTIYQLSFGNGIWQTGETSRHGPSLVADAKASFVGLPPLKINGAYRWKDGNTLELTLRYIESPHTEKISCFFDQNTISVDI